MYGLEDGASIIMRNRKETTRKPARRITKGRSLDEQPEQTDEDTRRSSLDTNEQFIESACNISSISSLSTESRLSLTTLDLECEESMDDGPFCEYDQIQSSPFAPCEEREAHGRRQVRWSLTSDDYLRTLLEGESVYFCDASLVLSSQPHITPVMRAILLDWMTEACSEFMFKRETLHCSVTHVDRFLSANPGVMKESFQLVGLVAIYIAAKSEVTCT
jgi:hypothetical protein